MPCIVCPPVCGVEVEYVSLCGGGGEKERERGGGGVIVFVGCSDCRIVLLEQHATRESHAVSTLCTLCCVPHVVWSTA